MMANVAELIKKMLTQGLSSLEKKQLSEEKQMKELLSCQWNEKSDQHLEDKVDSEAIWKNIAVTCWGTKDEITVTWKRKHNYIRFIYASAAIVALLIMGVWAADLLTDSYITVSAPLDKRIALVLPDSSKVWLNAGGTIHYQENFKKKREVKLEGEAFFEVVKMPKHPFQVLFQDACVEVKGTEFNVKSSQSLSEITLFSGKVIFTAPTMNNPIEMKPNEQIVYDASNHSVKLMDVDATEYDWNSSEYRFVDKPLSELIKFLNRIYQVDIIVKNRAYDNALFSGNIRKQEKITDVLNKICISLDLKQHQQGDQIVLD